MKFLDELFKNKQALVKVINKEIIAEHTIPTVIFMYVGKSLVPIPSTCVVEKQHLITTIIDTEKVVADINSSIFNEIKKDDLIQINYQKKFFSGKIKVLNVRQINF